MWCARPTAWCCPGWVRSRTAADGLDAVPGMVAALEETVRGKGRPFLGICVGMQLMADRGREYVVTDGLGWIHGEVDRITPTDPSLKIPHMGWNTLSARTQHKLLDGIPVGPGWPACLFCALLPASAGGPRRRGGRGRLWRAGHRHCRARQYGGNAIPPGKEPETWACADREFPEMEAVNRRRLAADQTQDLSQDLSQACPKTVRSASSL